jgi:PAS domain-containing protein
VRRGEKEFVWEIRVYNREILNDFLPLHVTAGMTWEDAWYDARIPEDKARTGSISDEALVTGKPGYSQEYRCVRADGRIQWIHEDARIRRVADDRWSIVGLCTDITVRKQREEELMQIFRAARCIIWHATVEVRPDNHLHWDLKIFNEEGVKDFCTVPVAPGQGWREAFYEAVPKDDHARMDATALQAIRSSEPRYSQEFRCIRPDGIAQWLHEDVRVEALKPGRYYLVGVITDITERKQAEENLRRVISSARCLLWQAVVDEKDGEYKWRIHAVGEDKVLELVPDLRIAPGQTASNVFFEDRPREEQQIMDARSREAFRSGLTSYSQEYRVPREGGQWRWIFEDVFIEPVGPRCWRVVGVCTDVDTRKRAEEEREKLITELRDALAKVKLLSGMLPICASCKKVRDDDGYWNQIDTYIRDHADVEFSHGICPDCAKKLYPEYSDG